MVIMIRIKSNLLQWLYEPGFGLGKGVLPFSIALGRATDSERQLPFQYDNQLTHIDMVSHKSWARESYAMRLLESPLRLQADGWEMESAKEVKVYRYALKPGTVSKFRGPRKYFSLVLESGCIELPLLSIDMHILQSAHCIHQVFPFRTVTCSRTHSVRLLHS